MTLTRQIDSTYVGDYWISTVKFRGSFYETMVFTKPTHATKWRWHEVGCARATMLKEAKANHAEAVLLSTHEPERGGSAFNPHHPDCVCGCNNLMSQYYTKVPA